MTKVIAIDFDGCLCKNKYPQIGEPNWSVIHRAVDEQKNGAKLVLWTCREGKLLDDAVTVCKHWGITFDAINENIGEWNEWYNTNPRKIGATEYWDDRAVKMDKDFSYSRPDEVGESRMTRQKFTSLQQSRNKGG